LIALFIVELQVKEGERGKDWIDPTTHESVDEDFEVANE